MSKEIVAVQIGHYSNFIGTHWWNIQQSDLYLYNANGIDEVETKKMKWDPDMVGAGTIDHNISFRSGLNLKGEETYTPRLICIDLKDSLKTLRQEGTLYDFDNGNETTRAADKTWMDDFKLNKSTSDSFRKNKFLQDLDKEEKSSATNDTDCTFSGISEQLYKLDNTVEVWSDYSGIHYHPKSIHLVESFRHNSDSFPFHTFGCGLKLRDNVTFMESWEDRMHFFIEECDSLQGFQVLVDAHDGFGGLASTLIQNVHDEIGNKTVLTFGSWPTKFHPTLDGGLRMLNSAMVLSQVSQSSDLFAPLSLLAELSLRNSQSRMFPHINYNNQNNYHTSAIIASCLDTVSLPYRVHGSATSLGDLCNGLNQTGHKIACSALSLPLPLSSKLTINNLLQETPCLYRTTLLQSLTPSCIFTNSESKVFSQNVTLRGQLDSKSETLNYVDQRLTNIPSVSEGLSPKGVLDNYLKSTYTNTITRSTLSKLPLFTTAPYPQYFDASVGSHGDIIRGGGRTTEQIVRSVSSLSSLCVPSALFDTLFRVADSAKKVSFAKYHEFQESGIERDELYENLETLLTIAQTYDAKKAFEFV